MPSHRTRTSSTFDRITWVADRSVTRETGQSATSGLVRPLPNGVAYNDLAADGPVHLIARTPVDRPYRGL